MLQSRYKVKLILNLLNYKVVYNIFATIYIFSIIDKYCNIICFNIFKTINNVKIIKDLSLILYLNLLLCLN